ncbi:MAG: PQQ-like beta-propeller repeat protein [Prolixibacteraceae bacterium]|nr:PQQ-like beta-propeller repeat protein [Prolixibacteraceae bacterium]MBN2775242.1 PQQ-like beta-propeller repeat protein [Prolixibacteraceae bacterium]
MLKRTILLLFVLTCFIARSQPENTGRQWPSYRGYFASGVLNAANLPDNWDAEAGENIKWKVKVPGLGLSSPVIWDNKLFITTAVSLADSSGLATGIFGSIGSVEDNSVHEWKVLCYNKNTGDLIWEQTSCTGIPKQKRHPKSTHANCTVATDGEFVVSFFGSEGLYCYNMNGDLQWKKDFGVLKAVFFAVPNAEWEYASSPIIYDGVVIIQNDVMENSFVAAFDVKTGKEIWKKERDEYPGWCTPTIYFDDNKTRIALNGYKQRGGYDYKTGEEIWHMSGGGDIQIPTPITGHNMVYFNSAHGRQSPILAIKSNAVGDITLKEDENSNDYVVWSVPRGGSYMGTMLLMGDYLYNAGWNGSLSCYNALTGETIYNEKAGSGNSYTSSPVGADGKIYFGDDNGIIYVIQAGPEYKLLAENPLNDIFMTTPAITEGMIYFRTLNYLIAVGK